MRDWKKWLRAAMIRAMRTVAQTAAGVLGSCAALGDVDWRMMVSAAALAGLLSLLTSVAGLPEADQA